MTSYRQHIEAVTDLEREMAALAEEHGILNPLKGRAPKSFKKHVIGWNGARGYFLRYRGEELARIAKEWGR